MYIDITPAVWFYCHRVVINRVAAAVAACVAPMAHRSCGLAPFLMLFGDGEL